MVLKKRKLKKPQMKKKLRSSLKIRNLKIRMYKSKKKFKLARLLKKRNLKIKSNFYKFFFSTKKHLEKKKKKKFNKRYKLRLRYKLGNRLVKTYRKNFKLYPKRRSSDFFLRFERTGMKKKNFKQRYLRLKFYIKKKRYTI